MLNVYLFKQDNKIDLLNLPKQVIRHINKYKNKQAKAISAFAWYKACDLLLDYDFNFKCLSFDKNEQPLITKSKIFFNISHSDKYVAIAISDSPVGIDLQKNVSIKQANFMAKKLLNNKQYANYSKQKNKSAIFTLSFTKIEAIYKMQHFLKKKKCNRIKCSSFSLLIDNKPYSISVINKYGERILQNELECEHLKLKFNEI